MVDNHAIMVTKKIPSFQPLLQSSGLFTAVVEKAKNAKKTYSNPDDKVTIEADHEDRGNRKLIKGQGLRADVGVGHSKGSNPNIGNCVLLVAPWHLSARN